MARSLQVTKATQPLPAARDDYSAQNHNNMRRIIELNFDEVYAEMRQVFDFLSGETERIEDLIEAAGHPPVTMAGPFNYIVIDEATQVITRGQIDLTTDVVDNLPVTNLDGGGGASPVTFWRGDGVWASPPTAAPADSEYITVGFSATTTVPILHSFGQFPAVQVLDINDEMLIPLSVVHNDLNNVTINFTGNETGTVILTIGGARLPTYREIAVNDAITTADGRVAVTVAGVEVTLPDATTVARQEFEIKAAVDTGLQITVLTVLGQLIDEFDEEIILYSSENMVVYSDGVGWKIS